MNPATCSAPLCFFLLAPLLAGGCGRAPEAGDLLPRRGDEVVACGQLMHAGTRVVLWLDAGGYDAYRLDRRFDAAGPGPVEAPERLARYGSYRGDLPEEVTARVRERGWSLADLRRCVRQVVIHFDACGTSRRCFEVLHDIRGLSCHFLLDLDGTVYQTLDLKERAWHAAQANEGSLGIEIAHIGAFSDRAELEKWYRQDGEGPRFVVPPGSEGALSRDFAARPRRRKPVRATINGRDLLQYDFTEGQYRALESLLVTLCRVFPRIKARVPRDGRGEVLDRAFDSHRELQGFEGLLGHWHVTSAKVDPGPAFDWERILEALRRAGIEG